MTLVSDKQTSSGHAFLTFESGTSILVTPTSEHTMLTRLHKPLAHSILAAFLVAAFSAAVARAQLTVTAVAPPGAATIAGVTVYLNGPTSLAIATGTNTVAFGPIPDGTYNVRVWAWPYCIREDVVTVAGPTSVSEQMSLACQDVITTGLYDATIAVVKGNSDAGAAACPSYQALYGGGRIYLPHNMLPASVPPCDNFVALMSRDHALWLANDATSLPWTAALGDQVATSLISRLNVPVKIFIVSLPDTVTVAAKMDQIRDIHLAKAEELLAGSFTGLVLGSAPGVAPEIQDLTGNSSVADVVGHDCNAANRIKLRPDLYDQGRLNVFYVNGVGVGTTAQGFTCVAQDAPNVILIHSGDAGPFILIHEIGHALGLTKPASGHTKLMSGFRIAGGKPLDVMSEWSELTSYYFSPGQVVQMNLSDGSWLNLPSANDGSTVRGRAYAPAIPPIGVCGCPETQAGQNCPPLTTDIPLGTGVTLSGPPLQLQACSLTVSPPSGAIGCGLPETLVIASYLQGSSPARGDGTTWISLTPDIVTASLDDTYTPYPPTTTRGKLRGVMSGAGLIKVWSGGSSVIFSVTVSCP